jgi:hypothetical protein
MSHHIQSGLVSKSFTYRRHGPTRDEIIIMNSIRFLFLPFWAVVRGRSEFGPKKMRGLVDRSD